MKNIEKNIRHIGPYPITKLTISRKPIEGVIKKAIDFADRNSKLIPYDTLYHLKLIVHVKFDNTVYCIEKEPYIKVYENNENDDGELMNVDITNLENSNSHLDESMAGCSIKTLLDKTQQLMGDSFFEYTGFQYNCQNFLVNILEANNLLTKEYYDFIMQEFDLEKIKNENPMMNNIANFVTDLDNIIKGRVLGGALEKLPWYNEVLV